jgi:hypothetical protein
LRTVSLEGVEPDGKPWRLEAATPAGLTGRELHRERLEPSGGLRGCLACGHPELYTQRDFPRSLGLAVVIVAAALAPFTAYLSLFAAALLDLLLYWRVRRVVVCYVCGARHRGFEENPRHPRFDLTIAERLRYGPRAVMGAPIRPGGTAGAPDPEH